MKLTIKTLKQVSYPVEIAQEATVGQLKSEIESKHNFDSKSMKLLYNGVVLDDQKSLSEIGIKDGHVIMMMNSKAKPQNIAKEEKKEEEPLPSSVSGVIGNVISQNQSQSQSQVKPSSTLKPQPVKDYSNEIQSLSEMGFSGDLAKNAIEAAKGNISLAIDYLYNGIPSGSQAHNPQLSEFLDEEEEIEPLEIDPEMLNNLDLTNPNTLKTIASIVKVLIQEDPSQLSQLLSDFEETNPEIIDFIKEHETEFKSLIEKPISNEDLHLFQSLAGESGHNHQEGEPDEDQIEEGIQNFLNNAQNLQQENPSTLVNINLSQFDREAVDRLMNLGFPEEDALQAYMACDKNETLAANFLFDNKFKDDMNIDCKK
jgi:UV excision repair protein RAD23